MSIWISFSRYVLIGVFNRLRRRNKNRWRGLSKSMRVGSRWVGCLVISMVWFLMVLGNINSLIGNLIITIRRGHWLVESISATTTTISSPITDTSTIYSPPKTCFYNHKISSYQQRPNKDFLNKKTGANWVGCSIRRRVSQAL